MAEEKGKTKKEKLLERLRQANKGKNFDNDDEVYDQVYDDYAKYDNDIQGYKDNESKLSNLFSSDPRGASFLSEWAEGGNPATILVKMFGTEIKDAIDDPQKQEEMAKAQQEYLDRVAESKKLDEEYQKNLQESLSNIESVQKKNNLTDDEVDKAMQLLQQIVTDGVMGKFTPETLDIAMKAINHDDDVKNAGHEGEVRGKNAKIEEKLKTAKKTDGTPTLDGKSGSAGSGEQDMPHLGALDKVNDEDIFSRGGMKRTKYQ